MIHGYDAERPGSHSGKFYLLQSIRASFAVSGAGMGGAGNKRGAVRVIGGLAAFSPPEPGTHDRIISGGICSKHFKIRKLWRSLERCFTMFPEIGVDNARGLRIYFSCSVREIGFIWKALVPRWGNKTEGPLARKWLICGAVPIQ